MNLFVKHWMTLAITAFVAASGYAFGAPGNGGAASDGQPGTAVPLPGPVGAAKASGNAQDADEAAPATRLSPRYTLRMGFDDRRYRGFHQHNSEELRTDDRVIAENDRIQQLRRAMREDIYR
jgi:hypothetical protein